MVTDHDGLEPGACRTWDYQRENQAVPGELGQAGRTARVWGQPTKASRAAPSGDRGDICWAPADGRRAHLGNGSAAHRVRAVLASPPVAPSSDADGHQARVPTSPKAGLREAEVGSGLPRDCPRPGPLPGAPLTGSRREVPVLLWLLLLACHRVAHVSVTGGSTHQPPTCHLRQGRK